MGVRACVCAWDTEFYSAACADRQRTGPIISPAWASGRRGFLAAGLFGTSLPNVEVDRAILGTRTRPPHFSRLVQLSHEVPCFAGAGAHVTFEVGGLLVDIELFFAYRTSLEILSLHDAVDVGVAAEIPALTSWPFTEHDGSRLTPE